jgi:hypothetical protein
VPADHDAAAVLGLPRQGRAKVDHVDRAERRPRVERLVLDLQSGGGEFPADVVAGLLDGRGSRGARPDLDHAAQILERARAIEHRPGRGGRRRCRRHARREHRHKKHHGLH